MNFQEVYLGLGGNVGDSQKIVQEALNKIAKIPQIEEFIVSPFYLTTPVSKVPQNHYVNAVCRFKTTLDLKLLFQTLENIEKELGKVAKPKDCPRSIDIDILFYGQETFQDEELKIPHPRWQERLFVLMPLADLTSFIKIIQAGSEKEKLFDIQKCIQEFNNIHNERVCRLSRSI